MPALTAFPLFLASSSPRRQRLLQQAGISFELLLSSVDEEKLTAEFQGSIAELGQYLATAKALEARAELVKREKWGRILAADTTVLLDGRSLAKPRDNAEAASMLRELRGRVHTVATGVALAEVDGCLRAATSTTLVQMRDFSDTEIERYVATGDPLDKAGAYSIQHPDFEPVQAISGCRLGVVGLPICIVWALLHPLQHLPIGAAEWRRDVAGTCPWSGSCTPPYPMISIAESTPGLVP
jgi:septum formation protein